MGTPTWEQISNIVKAIIEYDGIMDQFSNAIYKMCPSSGKPFVDFYNPLHILEVLYPDIADWVAYRLYESKSFGDGGARVGRPDGSEISIVYKDIDTLRMVLEKDNLIQSGNQIEERANANAQDESG